MAAPGERSVWPSAVLSPTVAHQPAPTWAPLHCQLPAYRAGDAAVVPAGEGSPGCPLPWLWAVPLAAALSMRAAWSPSLLMACDAPYVTLRWVNGVADAQLKGAGCCHCTSAQPQFGGCTHSELLCGVWWRQCAWALRREPGTALCDQCGATMLSVVACLPTHRVYTGALGTSCACGGGHRAPLENRKYHGLEEVHILSTEGARGMYAAGTDVSGQGGKEKG